MRGHDVSFSERKFKYSRLGSRLDANLSRNATNVSLFIRTISEHVDSTTVQVDQAITFHADKLVDLLSGSATLCSPDLSNRCETPHQMDQ